MAAFLGNVVGYEIGRAIGPPLYERDGRILKQKYFDKTQAFFDKHGNKALVIGRFVPFVRTYITVVAGVTRMERRRFFVWSFVGAVLWVLSITLLGYFLGRPGSRRCARTSTTPSWHPRCFSVIPIAYEWRPAPPPAATTTSDGPRPRGLRRADPEAARRGAQPPAELRGPRRGRPW